MHFWQPKQGLNLQPQESESCTLPIELFGYMVRLRGLEPRANALKGRCSTSWAKGAYGVTGGTRIRNLQGHNLML